MTLTVDFSGKVALVTGAGRGTGLQAAMALAARGAKVYVNDLNPDKARAAATAIREAGGQAMDYQVSVDNKVGVQTMFMTMLEAWGRLDFLIHHATIKPKSGLLKMDEWHWNKALSVNLTGTFLCNQTASRAMQEQGQGGVIINVMNELPLPQRTVYQTSLAGVAGFTQAVAAELAEDDIRVNLLCLTADSRANDLLPADIQTPAEAVLFLCSDQGRQITGQKIMIRDS